MKNSLILKNLLEDDACEEGVEYYIKYIHSLEQDLKLKKVFTDGINDYIEWLFDNNYIDIKDLKLLINQKININICDNYAIRWASANGHLEIVKLLIKNGADVTDCDNYAIIRVSQYGYLEIVKLLIKNGADVKADDNSAIRWASENGHLEVVKLLKKHGAKL